MIDVNSSEARTVPRSITPEEVTDASMAVSDTAPPKTFATLFSAMFPFEAVAAAVPTTFKAPACVMLPVSLCVTRLPTLAVPRSMFVSALAVSTPSILEEPKLSAPAALVAVKFPVVFTWPVVSAPTPS